MDTKQVIVVRKDLNMRKGKLAAQVAHASMKAIIDEGYIQHDTIGLDVYVIPMRSEVKTWLEGLFTKVVVGVKDYEELIAIYAAASGADVPCCLIEDEGLTEFHGKRTCTAVAVGPAACSKIDAITGHLKLL